MPQGDNAPAPRWRFAFGEGGPPSRGRGRDTEIPAAVADSVELPPAAAVEPPSAGKASYPHPDADVRMAERQREEAALEALEAGYP